MFLNQLTKQEKLAFVDLAQQVVNADGDYSIEEESLLTAYLSEMQIENNTHKPVGLETQDILSHFIDKKSRRIVYIEILALAHADQDYSSEEKTIVEIIEKAFEITEKEKLAIISWLEKIKQIYSEGYKLINI